MSNTKSAIFACRVSAAGITAVTGRASLIGVLGRQHIVLMGKIKGRLEFTGRIALDMQHFIGKDVSLYYNKGEANPIKYMELDQLQNLIREYIVYPDDIDDNDLFEGSKKQITVNAYERSLQARQNCIAHYGTKCVICSFDFKKIYCLILIISNIYFILVFYFSSKIQNHIWQE